MFSSAFSAGNACTFLASRTLQGLALDGHAPVIFTKLNRFGIPYVAVAASGAWGAVAYTSLNQGSFKVRSSRTFRQSKTYSNPGVLVARVSGNDFRYHLMGYYLFKLPPIFSCHGGSRNTQRVLAVQKSSSAIYNSVYYPVLPSICILTMLL